MLNKLALMIARIPRLQFPLEPLIAEAKRRACQKRFPPSNTCSRRCLRQGWPAALSRAEKISKVEAVTCTWQIPANAAGQQLRLGRPAEQPGLVARTTATASRPASITSMAPSWVVRR